MLKTRFTAHSGTDHEWFVFKPHGLFPDVWYCYPIKRYLKNPVIKESFIQCFDTDFITKRKIEMTFKNYQELAVETAVYGAGDRIIYPALGLANEAGEVLGKIKKVLRDRNGVFTGESNQAIGDEIGDVLWYIAALSRDLGLSLDDIAERNIQKLIDRKARNVIQGSGDNR
jgi:NTP pyrophosphatase (non-canonical NTP hydrolase)